MTKEDAIRGVQEFLEGMEDQLPDMDDPVEFWNASVKGAAGLAPLIGAALDLGATTDELWAAQGRAFDAFLNRHPRVSH